MYKTKEELILSLNNKDESERMYAVADIFDSGNSDLSMELVKRLNSEKSNAVRNSIVSVLQKIENPNAYLGIFAFFPSEDPFLRNSAVSIFSSYGEEAVTFLSSYLDHSNKEVRKLILDSLVEIAINKPISTQLILNIFRACLHDPDINVVITAVEYLGKLKDRSSVEDVENLFKKLNEPMLRSSILEMIIKVGTKEEYERVLEDLFENNYLGSDSIYFPQILRLLAYTGKNSDFLDFVNSMDDLKFYSEDILIAIDWLVKNEDFDPRRATEILKEITKNKYLKEDLKFICVQLILASRDSDSIEFVRNWGKESTEDFRSFCEESISVISNG